VSGVKQQWVLGNPFLRAYFSIFDLSEDAQRIGLVGGTMAAERFEVTYSMDVDFAHNVWWIMMIILIILFLLILCTCLIVRSCCQRRIILRLEKPVETEESADETQPVDISVIQIVEPKKHRVRSPVKPRVKVEKPQEIRVSELNITEHARIDNRYLFERDGIEAHWKTKKKVEQVTTIHLKESMETIRERKRALQVSY